MEKVPMCGRLSTWFFIAQLLLVVVIVFLGVEKLVLFGIASYVSHVTNWSWTFLGLFLFVTLPYIIPRRNIPYINVRCAGYMVAACFFPLLLIVSFVTISVFVLLLEDAAFITNLLGKMEIGVVMFWNDIFHVFPFIVMVFFGFMLAKFVLYGLKLWFVPAKARGTCALVWLYIYQIIGGSLLLFGVYLLTLVFLGTTVNEIYDTEFPIGAGFGLLILVSLLVNGVILLILTCKYGLLRPSANPDYDEQRSYMTDEEIFGPGNDLVSMLKKQESAADVAVVVDTSPPVAARPRQTLIFGHDG